MLLLDVEGLVKVKVLVMFVPAVILPKSIFSGVISKVVVVVLDGSTVILMKASRNFPVAVAK